MARLPTVTLRRRRDGKIFIVNLSDYALDLPAWRAGYERVGETRGDAADGEVAFAMAEAAVNHDRAAARDAPRLAGAAAISVRGDAMVSAAAAGEAPPPPQPATAPSQVTAAFQAMNFFKLKAECKRLGRDVATKAEALAFLKELGLISGPTDSPAGSD